MYMNIDYPTHVAKEYSKYATVYVYTYNYIDLYRRECVDNSKLKYTRIRQSLKS